jgi:hypothetical protein
MIKVVINLNRDLSKVAGVLFDFNQTSTYRQILLKPSSLTIHANPSKRSR